MPGVVSSFRGLFRALVGFACRLFFVGVSPSGGCFLRAVSVFVVPVPRWTQLLACCLCRFFFEYHDVPWANFLRLFLRANLFGGGERVAVVTRVASSFYSGGVAAPLNKCGAVGFVSVGDQAAVVRGDASTVFVRFAAFVVVVIYVLLVIVVVLVLLHFFFLLFHGNALCSACPANEDNDAFGIGYFDVSCLVRVYVDVVAFCCFDYELRYASGLFSAFRFIAFRFQNLVRRCGVAGFGLLSGRVFGVLFIGALANRVITAEGLALRARNVCRDRGAVRAASPMHVPRA